MRRYDDPVDVRKGRVAGPGGATLEAPEQFLWRGRLWKVCAVVAHWVETGPWWQSSGVQTVLGAEDDGAGAGAGSAAAPGVALADPVEEREFWRVEAARGRVAAQAAGSTAGRGVFDLVFDWAEGSWQLVRCVD